jgi:DNA-directed RNA polymerase
MSLSLVRQAALKHSLKNQLRIQATKSTALLRPLSYYSTEAVVKEDSEASNRIILPNPALSTFKAKAHIVSSTIAEQFAILNACINSGSMDRAERIMFELYKARPEEMKVFADVHVYNTFLNGFIDNPKPMKKECLSWFDSMKVHGVAPDSDTYAIILKAFLR